MSAALRRAAETTRLMQELYPAMAQYNRWMNRKIYALVATLPDAERKRDAGAFFGSIHGTLNHLLLADYAWMRRFTGDLETYCARDSGGKPVEVTSLDQILYDDFGALREERERVDTLVEAWASVQSSLHSEALRISHQPRTERAIV